MHERNHGPRYSERRSQLRLRREGHRLLPRGQSEAAFSRADLQGVPSRRLEVHAKPAAAAAAAATASAAGASASAAASIAAATAVTTAAAGGWRAAGILTRAV